MQSGVDPQADVPLHVAIVMDGNGRWGTRRGLDRSAGHRAGSEVVEHVVDAAPQLGVGTLTLFAFSADNWRRPRPEVQTLMRLLRAYVRTETSRCVQNGVRLSVVGRRDRLGAPVVRAIERAERATRNGTRLHLRIAIDYSARQAIADAARRWARTPAATVESLGRLITDAVPDVDLLVRTGGEQRLSDFMLWECAYAELYFVERLWPDFTPADLAGALDAFRGRERRFGAAPPPPALPPAMPTTSRGWVDRVMAAVGLASNLAALRALVTDGIQAGHMALHARAVAHAAGARGALADEVSRRLVAGGDVKLDVARALLRTLQRAAS
jgi:undecaprenyl diphosphate synthase